MIITKSLETEWLFLVFEIEFTCFRNYSFCSVLNKLTLLKFEIHMEELKKYTPYTESERMSYIREYLSTSKRSISLPSVRVFAVVC